MRSGRLVRELRRGAAVVGAVVMCAVIWSGALWVAQRCWRMWRGGGDLLWQRRWGAVSGALTVGALAMMSLILLRLPFLHPGVPVAAALLLLLGSAGCAVARSIAVRRDEEQSRQMRADLGLPTERWMRSPMVLFVWWCVAGLLTAVTYCSVVAVTVYAEAVPADRTEVVEAGVNRTVLIFGAFLTVGALHALVQYQRRLTEQTRIRMAERRFLEEPVEG